MRRRRRIAEENQAALQRLIGAAALEPARSAPAVLTPPPAERRA